MKKWIKNNEKWSELKTIAKECSLKVKFKDQVSKTFALMKEAHLSSGKLFKFYSSESWALSVEGIVGGERLNKKGRKIQ